MCGLCTLESYTSMFHINSAQTRKESSRNYILVTFSPRNVWAVRSMVSELPKTLGTQVSMLTGSHHPENLQKRPQGLPWWLSGKESTCRCERDGYDLWSLKTPQAKGQLSPCTATTDALEPRSHNHWSLCTLEPMLLDKRSHWNEKPVHHN